jgi:hypothetical protein
MLAVLGGENGGLTVVHQVPVLWPGPCEVLVRMAAAPIKGTANPTRMAEIER